MSSAASVERATALAALRSRPNLIQLLFACAGIIIVLALASRLSWSVDFNQYYAAGKLAGTGHLYDWNAIEALELEHNAEAVPFGRFPVYALFFKGLSILPYSTARVLFFLIEIAAVVGFVLLWPFSPRAWAWVGVCWSTPIAICLVLGQDTVLFLFSFTMGFYLLRRDRDFLAGVAFAVCASKPHIAAILPVILIAQSRWRAIWGGIAGGIVLASASFAAEGLDWPARLMALTGRPDFDPTPTRMPNLRGLLSFVGAGLTVEVILSVALATGIFFICRRLPLKSAMTLALGGGLLLSHHSYIYDCVLLLPALMLPFEDTRLDRLRTWAVILFNPLPYMLVLSDSAFLGHIALTGYTLVLIGFLARTVSARAYSATSPRAERPTRKAC